MRAEHSECTVEKCNLQHTVSHVRATVNQASFRGILWLDGPHSVKCAHVFRTKAVMESCDVIQAGTTWNTLASLHIWF